MDAVKAALASLTEALRLLDETYVDKDKIYNNIAEVMDQLTGCCAPEMRLGAKHVSH